MENPKAPKMLRASRKRPVSTDANPPSEKLRKLSESTHAHEKHGNDGLKSLKAEEYVPHQSIGLMYRVALSTLCLSRIYRHEDEYSSLTISFEDDRFRNIVINYKYKESDDHKSLHVQVEDVDTHDTDEFMSYVELFGKRKRSNLNQRFNSFFEFEISKSEDSAEVKYLIIYSSLALNLADDGRLKQLQCKKFYAFQFRKMDLGKHKILKDIISSHEEGKEDAEGKFHRFSRDEALKNELLGRLKLNKPMQDLMRKKNVSPEFEIQIKKKFLNKLVIASEMPKRPQLRVITKEENEKTKLSKNYTSLQQRVLSDLSAPKKRKNAQHPIPGIIHAFNLLTFLLHTMFHQESLFSIKIEGRSQNSSHDILLNYGKGFILIRPVFSKIINYRHFFPFKDKQKLEFSINDCFALFLQKIQTGMEFFIIFTNARLNFGKNNELAKKPSGGAVPVKFKNIDVDKKKYEILKKCGFLKEDGLYRFSRKKVTREKILSLLEYPDFCEEKLCTEGNKKKFLGKLIIAVDQANEKELKKMVKRTIKKHNRLHELPYNYEELNEITIRSLESTKSGVITKKTMKKILKDV